MNILVVHNDNAFLCMIIDVLRLSGYIPMRAVNLKEAREVLEMEQIGLVVAVGRGEGDDGLRLLSFVREFSEHPEIPFVFVCEDDEETLEFDASRGEHCMNSGEGALAIVDMLEHIGFMQTSSMTS